MRATVQQLVNKPDLRYGIICGVALSLWVLIEFILGFHTSLLSIGRYSGYAANILPVIFIYMAMSEFQIRLQRKISFVEGITVGFRTTFIFSVIIVIFLYFYNTVINPQWIESLIEWERKQLIINGASNDDIGRFVQQHRRINSAFGQAIMGFFSYTAVGVLVTVIEIPFVRRTFTTVKTLV